MQDPPLSVAGRNRLAKRHARASLVQSGQDRTHYKIGHFSIELL